MKTTIDGREYEVEAKDMINTPRLRDELLANGFDGVVYILTGKHGAMKMAYRSAKSGAYKII